MISRPSVIVVGAGGSAGYEFPIGTTLIGRITSHLKGPNTPLRRAINLSGLHADIDAFRDRLIGSDAYSIDRFLEANREEFQAIGKAAIAYSILRAEQNCTKKDLLIGSAPEDHWLRWLWDRIRKECEADTLEQNRLTIVTFNYDRLIEHYLIGRIESSFNLEHETARIIQETAVPVVHLYGQLEGVPFGEFNEDVIPGALMNYASGIRVIHDEVASDDPFFQKARHVISGAEEIVCLGVGYDPVNMSRLQFQNARTAQRGVGSVFGLARGEVEQASEDFGFPLNPDHADLMCEAFLRTAARLR